MSIALSPHVALINESAVLTDAQVTVLAGALQHQAVYHFKPHWGIECVVTPYTKGSTIPASSWGLALLDDSDQAGALGYHDQTNTGQPLGKVFAKTDRDNGYDVNITASHELLEMLADPWVDNAVQVASAVFYALEVCDACEADSYGYAATFTVNGVSHTLQVSDFVLPHWFDGVGSAPYDYKGHITTPHALLPGGYIGEWTPGSGWTQKSADSASPASRRLEQRQRRHGAGLERSTV